MAWPSPGHPAGTVEGTRTYGRASQQVLALHPCRGRMSCGQHRVSAELNGRGVYSACRGTRARCSGTNAERAARAPDARALSTVKVVEAGRQAETLRSTGNPCYTSVRLCSARAQAAAPRQIIVTAEDRSRHTANSCE
jgi:hypothetical protein